MRALTALLMTFTALAVLPMACGPRVGGGTPTGGSGGSGGSGGALPEGACRTDADCGNVNLYGCFDGTEPPFCIEGACIDYPPCADDAECDAGFLCELVTGGLYRVIRHPSYLGLLLGLFGWALVFRSAIGVLVSLLLLPPLVARMNAEEALLESEFGERYADYRRRTWRLVPFLY